MYYYFTEKDYTPQFSAFIRTEQRRSTVITSARFQPFCRKNNFNIGYYDGYVLEVLQKEIQH